jgi:hypothetical protein
LHRWGLVEAPGARPAERVIVDPHGELPGLTEQLLDRLALLSEERLCARESGLMTDLAYAADLELEVRHTRHAHTGAVVLQLAFLRAALAGRGRG